MQGMKNWLRNQNERGRYVLLGSVLRRLLSFYYFHPRQRFLNWLTVQYQTRLGNWKRLSFGRSMLQRVFYVCSQETPVGKIVIKLPRGDNQFSCNLIAAVGDNRVFEDYKKLLTTLTADPWLTKHCVGAVSIRRDGGYTSEFVDGFNLAELKDGLFDPSVLPKDLRGRLAKAIDELLADLLGYEESHGKIIGDWALHNLVFSPERASIVNVDTEGFFTFTTAGVETDRQLLERILGDIREFLRMLDSPSPEDQKAVAVFRILDDVRRSGASYSGLSFIVGYHSLELNGRMFRGQRECSQRLAQVPYDFTGKVVVDLGCNSGGMLHALSKIITQGYGFDFNPKCVNAAQSVQLLNGASNLQFFTFDLDRDDLSLLPCFIPHKHVDICFLLSVCMWLKRWRLVVHHTALLTETLLFESNGSVEQQEEQMALVRSYFDQVELISDNSPDDPLQASRKLYLCAGKTNAARAHSAQERMAAAL